jgi:hypothetical protein
MLKIFKALRRWWFHKRYGLIPEYNAEGRIVCWVNPKVLAELRRRVG